MTSELAPSKSYLVACNKPGSSSISPQKLLVLDLDGTLVCRASMLPSAAAPPPATSTKESKLGSAQTRRNVTIPQNSSCFKPRPFVHTLISYLFHPDTTTWLTTMVWSLSKRSAVDEMVRTCFGEKHKHLAAIWSREDLTADGGKGERQATRKTEGIKVKTKAVKDLERIWNRSDLCSTQLSSNSIRSALDGFSQINTVLLDDTPGKAANQPFNYVPISKYRLRTNAPKHRSSTQSPTAPVTGTILESSSPDTLSSYALSSLTGIPTLSTASEDPDHSLLAIIGILSILRDVPKVSYWIKKGGLARLSNTGHNVGPMEVSSNPVSGRVGVPESSIDESKTTKRSSTPWHEIPPVHRYWVEQGRREAERLGLGVVPYPSSRIVSNLK